MSKPQCDWTVGVVNYNTSVYIKWQLKLLYENNDPCNFKFIIVDNSCNEAEKKKLEAITAPYIDKYHNLEVIYHTPKARRASGQHGEGLDIIHKKADTKYLQIQDPDHFWVKKNYLNWLAALLNEKTPVVGTPYNIPIALGHPNFPGPFGCAFLTSAIKDYDLKAYLDDDYEKSTKIWEEEHKQKGLAYTHDTTWKVRAALSNPKDSSNFISFSQAKAYYLVGKLGVYTYELIPTEYKYKNETVGFHLHRGSFSGKVSADACDPKLKTPQAWKDAREKYGEYFYSLSQGLVKKPTRLEKLLCYRKFLNNFPVKTRISYIVSDVIHQFRQGMKSSY